MGKLTQTTEQIQEILNKSDKLPASFGQPGQVPTVNQGGTGLEYQDVIQSAYLHIYCLKYTDSTTPVMCGDLKFILIRDTATPYTLDEIFDLIDNDTQLALLQADFKYVDQRVNGVSIMKNNTTTVKLYYNINDLSTTSIYSITLTKTNFALQSYGNVIFKLF